jgi:hypothetical protein
VSNAYQNFAVQPCLQFAKFFSRANSCVSVELKRNISEISLVSIIRVDVVIDRMPLVFTPVRQIDAFSYT